MLLGLMLGVAFGVTGCKEAAPKKLEQKTFHLRGRITAVDAAGGEITVAHQAIPGFMEAMTMSYKLRGAEHDQRAACGGPDYGADAGGV